MYSLFLNFVSNLLRVFSFVNPKIKSWILGQKNVWIELEQFNPFKVPVIWIHAASVGEFEQGRPLIERMRRENPNHFLVLTFFSPSGYQHLKNYSQVDKVLYLPLDTKYRVNKFLSILKPQLAIFIKYEFWPNYIHALNERKIPLVLISAIFRKEQVFFRWYGGYFRRLLAQFDKIFLQNKASNDLLKSIGIKSAQVVGDTRFDRVIENSQQLISWEIKQTFIDKKKFIVCGSVWKEDMEILVPLINNPELNFAWIIVPHEINPKQMEEWERDIQEEVVYSSRNQLNEIKSAKVLFVDEMGKLSGLYKDANFAYIGGAFRKGLHNTLEAAVFGPPLFFGNKNYQKFDEAVQLVQMGNAFPVENSKEILEKILYLEKNKKEREKIEERSIDFILGSKGATDTIFNYVQPKIR